MIGYRIASVLSLNPDLYSHVRGIYSIDTLPKKLHNLDYAIFNISKSCETGRHWVCLHKTLDSNLEILDPLPSEFAQKRFQEYLHYFETECEINSVNLQRRNSDSCGPMVIFYCYSRFMNEDLFFEDYLNLYFSKSVTMNESIVKEYLDELQASK